MRGSNSDNDDPVMQCALHDEALHKMLLDELDQGVCIVNRESRILYWNRAAERISGFLGHEVAGQAIRGDLLLHGANYQPALGEEHSATLVEAQAGKPVAEMALLLHREGHRILVRLQSYPIHDSNGEALGALDLFQEIKAAGERGIREYEACGCSDPSTCCAKRHYGELVVLHALETLNMFGVSFGWLRVGLDGAGDLDRTFGHGMVEAAVKMVAAALDRNLGSHDVLTRWDQSELRVLINRCSHSELAAAAERLCLFVRASTLEWWGDRLHVTVSMGGAASEPGDTLDSLEARASDAFEGCRAAGGNRAAVAQMMKGGAGRCSQ